MNLKKVNNRKIGGAIPNFDEWKVSDLKKLYNILEVNGLDKEELMDRLKTHFEAGAVAEEEAENSPPASPPSGRRRRTPAPAPAPATMPSGLTPKQIKSIYNKRYRDKQKASAQ